MADTAATAAAASSGADAAGGEAIYSSDGLPPLPTPIPPIKSKIDASAAATDDAVLDSDSVSPSDAFEVFGGKAYLRPGRGGGRRSGASSATTGGSGDGDGGGAAAVESPLVRLARLSAEVSELEKDLSTSASTAASVGAPSTGVSKEELSRLARELATRLEVAGNKHGVVASSGGNVFKGQQDDLTKLVLEELTSTTVLSAAAASGASDGKSSGDSTHSGVVYELYASSATGHVGSTTAATATVESSIEERLGRIERSVGAQSSLTSTTSGGRSLVERLEEAEKLVKRVDGKSLDAAAARAKVIRADLEAAAKAKTKLSAALSTLSANDAKTISSLHTQLQDLEGISAHLPTIVSRLQDLSSLHTQASSFATRLTAVENAANEAARLIKGVEDAVDKVETGWQANSSAIESNVKALDERIKSLS
mmetsp:Transcript_25055/g.54624  ORF Transcript_25055/g.54624 Transcript_25055/m.54624 type:complete len:425 (-) Transcript_25055:2079-3353(-)|eukprot:CAMPEP_0178622578 /NCGR_PEP_ID=MMETSP0698-20121128/6400_1 /TAXON_ID=265572 /ORGANISM="Extubocellulus spinifer, Strain CCMP396" /LENGTH=424 /DNA_ID=CAMNT_0020261645 /DNA_START=24 /DNA_END=1298 /DNA_ORIENTATION=+